MAIEHAAVGKEAQETHRSRYADRDGVLPAKAGG
jgi:hypothetical protein